MIFNFRVIIVTIPKPDPQMTGPRFEAATLFIGTL